MKKSTASAKRKQVILISGASAGIGKEMARAMIQRGHIVYGCARRVDKMQDLVKLGGYAVQLDVTNHQQIVNVVQQILKEQGRIDVLVNNAGISLGGPAEEVPIIKVRQLFDVNFFGLIDLTQQVLPHMRKVKQGLIVNVSSVGGKVYGPFSGPYIASKHAVEGWTDCLRAELSLFNIQVSLLEPGYIKTEIMDLHQDIVMDKDTTSPYKDMINKHQQEQSKNFKDASHPSVVADALVHATESGTPQRRYVMGHLATLILFIRAWLGDSILDFIIKSNLSKALSSAQN